MFQGFRDGPGVRGERDDHAVEDVVEFAKAVQIAIDHGDVRAHAERDLGGVRADDSAANDGDIGGRHAGDAAEQNAAATVRAFEVLRAHLHGHAAGDFAHRREKRQRAVRLQDGFVGDAGDAGIDHRLGEFGQRREVEIGEEDEVAAEETVFGRLRLFDFGDEIGVVPDMGRGGHDFGAGGMIVLIAERTAFARMGFDENLVAAFAKSGGAAGHQTDAGLVVFYLFGNTYHHDFYVPTGRLKISRRTVKR